MTDVTVYVHALLGETRALVELAKRIDEIALAIKQATEQGPRLVDIHYVSEDDQDGPPGPSIVPPR